MHSPSIDDFTNEDLFKMVQEFKKEYDVVDLKKQPLKTVMVMEHENGIPTGTSSVMWGMLPVSKYFGSKTIFVRDEEGGTKRASTTTLFKPNGELAAVYESSSLTTLRCAVMAVYAISKVHTLDERSWIGFIGAGKINTTIMEFLNRVYNIRNFVLKRKNPSFLSNSESRFVDRMMKLGNSYIDQVEQGSHGKPFKYLMKKCHVVSSATTNSNRKAVLGVEDVQGPQLLIAWDTGYLFGASIRASYHHFADNSEQVNAVREIEYPWDLEWETPYDLRKLVRGALPAIVSFYGIALADLVVAKATYEKFGGEV